MPTSKRRRCTRERIRGGSLKSLRRCYRRSCGRHVSRLPTNSSPHRRLPLYAEPKLANSALKREAEQTTPHKNSQRINAGVPDGGASQRRPAEWGADRPASGEHLGGPAGRGGGRLRSGRLGFLLRGGGASLRAPGLRVGHLGAQDAPLGGRVEGGGMEALAPHGWGRAVRVWLSAGRMGEGLSLRGAALREEEEEVRARTGRAVPTVGDTRLPLSGLRHQPGVRRRPAGGVLQSAGGSREPDQRSQ